MCKKKILDQKLIVGFLYRGSNPPPPKPTATYPNILYPSPVHTGNPNAGYNKPNCPKLNKISLCFKHFCLEIVHHQQWLSFTRNKMYGLEYYLSIIFLLTILFGRIQSNLGSDQHVYPSIKTILLSFKTFLKSQKLN